MQDFLKSYFSDLSHLQIENLKGDGGRRSYKRLKKGSQTFILMSCGGGDPSLKLFVEIQSRLKNFVPVPQIFHLNLKTGFLLLEDLGDKSLEHVFLKKDKNLSLSFYQKALKQLIDLQSRILPAKRDPVFDIGFFLDEINQSFCDIEKYLCDVLKRRPYDKKLLQAVKKEMNQIMSCIQKEDYVYCHRDYHSRNLMIKDNKVWMIDFQDAGKGPWCYDLASLLYDCYTPLSNRNELAQFYFENRPASLKQKVTSLSQVQQMLKFQFLQRGFKACGRFCAFKIEDNKDSHLKYLKPTFTLLRKTAQELNQAEIFNYAHFLVKELESSAPA